MFRIQRLLAGAFSLVAVLALFFRQWIGFGQSRRWGDGGPAASTTTAPFLLFLLFLLVGRAVTAPLIPLFGFGVPARVPLFPPFLSLFQFLLLFLLEPFGAFLLLSAPTLRHDLLVVVGSQGVVLFPILVGAVLRLMLLKEGGREIKMG